MVSFLCPLPVRARAALRPSDMGRKGTAAGRKAQKWARDAAFGRVAVAADGFSRIFNGK